jgi:5-methylcytosine-specific restriction endonuclease McrA
MKIVVEKGVLVSKFFLTLDHIRPISKGGSDILENIIICHRDTNEEKADTFPNWYANGRRFQARKVKGTSNEYDIYQMD